MVGNNFLHKEAKRWEKREKKNQLDVQMNFISVKI